MDRSFETEEKIQSIGRVLYSTISAVPPMYDTGTWIGRVMDRAMRNENFKLRLFRFIDVLPSLRTDKQVVRLLREYFGEDAQVPKIISRGISIVPEKSIFGHAAGYMVRKAVETIARQFIAGNDPEDIITSLNALIGDGTRFTIDLLGETVVSDREAQAYSNRYSELFDLLHTKLGQDAQPDVSLKVSSFYSQIDPVSWQHSIECIKEGLRPLLQKAKKLGLSLTFDMEHYYYKSLILAVFKSVLEEEEFEEHPFVSIALQTYLKDTHDDLRKLIGWARERKRKIGVRLVKGAYWDYEIVRNRQLGWPIPVFRNKQETDASYEQLTRLLLENSDIVYTAIASHNLRSIAHAISVADSFNVSKKDFEFQTLYGMAEPLRRAVREQGFMVRVYVPVGRLIPGRAYLVRRLLENTSNLSFLRNSFGRASLDDLLKPPASSQSPDKKYSQDGFRNESLLDFSVTENRKKMEDAIRAIKDGLHGAYPLLIGNRAVRTERELLSRNPARPREVIGRISSASKKDADAAIEEAIKVREQWRRTPPEKRADFLFRAAEEIRKQRFELAALEVIEVGKTWKDADGDVAEAIDYLEYYGREMIRLGRPKVMGNYPGEENEYFYIPKGVGVVIAPWNFPLAIAAGMSSAAIVTGNCAIFKPSGLSAVTGYKLCDIFRSVGLPPGVLQFLPGPGSEIGEYLVSHPGVDFIAFTGSKDVGLRIVGLAAETKQGQRNVKKVIAELGGKNAIIVDETADLDEAVKSIIESAFGYQGQKCSACSRLIVIGDIFNELCGRLVEAVSSLKIGPPEDPASSVGPVIDESALKKIQHFITVGKQEAKAVVECSVSGEGYFVGPVVFIDAKPDSRIATEEIFGPVLTLTRAKDIEEAIDLANNSQYALTGGLFSRSPAAILKVKETFLTGNLYINRKITGAQVGRQPFGGFGMSGIGSKAGGPDYLLQFMNPVCSSENTIRKGFAPYVDPEQAA